MDDIITEKMPIDKLVIFQILVKEFFYNMSGFGMQMGGNGTGEVFKEVEDVS